MKWINAYTTIDDEDLLLKGQSIIRGVHLEVANEYKIDRRGTVPRKSIAWSNVTWNHFNHHIHSGGCSWCQGFTHFQSRYPHPSMNASSSQGEDGTSESMKK